MPTNAKIPDDLAIGGALDVAGAAHVGGSADVDGNLNVDGSTQVDGALTVGTAPPAGTEPVRVDGGARYTGLITADLGVTAKADVRAKNALDGGAFRPRTPVVSSVVANNATLVLFPGTTQVSGLLTISDSNGGNGIFNVDNRTPAANRCRKIDSLGGFTWSAAKDTAGNLNVYVDAATGAVTFQNLSGGPAQITANMFSGL